MKQGDRDVGGGLTSRGLDDCCQEDVVVFALHRGIRLFTVHVSTSTGTESGFSIYHELRVH